MKTIEQLIAYNREKIVYMNEYLDVNAMISEMSQTHNISAIKKLVIKKQGLITSINIIDDKLIKGIARLKETLGIDDLSDIKVTDYPQIVDLKIAAGDALKQMVIIRQSDDQVKTVIDRVFAQMSSDQSAIEKNKLYYYTKQWLEK